MTKYFWEVRKQIGIYVHSNYEAIASDLREVSQKQFNNIVDIYGAAAANAEKEKIEAYYRELFGVDSIDEITAEVVEKVAKNTDNVHKIVDELFKYDILPESLRDEYLQTLEALTQNEADLLEQRYENWMSLADGIAKLMGGIGDCFEVQVDLHKKKLEADGKLDDKERKMLEDQYNNTVKPMRIAEATISTITGAIDAFTSAQKLGPPMGPILGAVNAAAVIAAGIANIAKIASTNPYSDNSSSLNGATASMSATVTPTVSDYNPEYTSNLTGKSDTDYLNEALGKQKLFVSVVDINDAQERGRVRVAESSF